MYLRYHLLDKESKAIQTNKTKINLLKIIKKIKLIIKVIIKVEIKKNKEKIIHLPQRSLLRMMNHQMTNIKKKKKNPTLLVKGKKKMTVAQLKILIILKIYRKKSII